MECTGHVQKRMGKRLLDKISQCRGNVHNFARKKVEGIGGAGKLTKASVTRIQGHYVGAIRKHLSDVEKMKETIWQTWHHKNGDHDKCDENWCDRSHKNKLPEFVMKEIKNVFVDLTDERLLEKCLHGSTQNANKSFHHMKLEEAPEFTVFVEKESLLIAVSDGTIVFYDGELGKCEVFRRSCLRESRFQIAGFRDLDLRRIKAAEQKTKPTNNVRKAKKTLLEPRQESGDEDYQSGAF